MPRYKLTIEYDGAPFAGFQRQHNLATVQGAIEQAIFLYCQQTVTLVTAGRTDSGVHATGQVAHVDLTGERAAHRVQDALNYHVRNLPISILAVEQVGDDFHARFSALARHYRYQILLRRAPVALERGRVWQIRHPLDVAAMRDAARVLLGKHDFTTFRHVNCQSKSPVKTLDRLDVDGRGDRIVIEASARSFLHTQVRSLVGALVMVGDRRWTRADLEDALRACNRKRCAPIAPSHGLYLVKVDY